MRWETLFADLAGQLEAVDTIEREAVVSDLTRAEWATLTLADRLRAVVGSPVAVTLRGGQEVHGQVREVHDDWLLLVSAGREILVPTSAAEVWRGLGARAAPVPASRVRVPTTLARALREVARDRGIVSIGTTERAYVGRINRVGRDHVDLVPARDGDRGRPVADEVVVIALDAITCVSST